MATKSNSIKDALLNAAAFVQPVGKVAWKSGGVQNSAYVTFDPESLKTHLVEIGTTDGVLIGEVSSSGQLRINTMADIPNQAWRKASNLYQNLYGNLPRDILETIGMADKIDLIEQAKAEKREKRAKAKAKKTLQSEADLTMVATAKPLAKAKSTNSKASSNGKTPVTA